MGPGETTSVLWLWLLGLAWGLGPWLALALAALLATTAIRSLHQFARQIETRPVGAGFPGFLGILRDSALHRAALKGVILTVIGGVVLAGLLSAGIQGLVQQQVQELSEEEVIPVPRASHVNDAGGPLDWILLAGLISVLVTCVVGIRVYRALRSQALDLVSSSSVSRTHRPLVVRLFYDHRAMGIVLVVAGGWLLCGFLTQLAALFLLLFPAMTAKPIPGVMTAAIVLLVLLGVVGYAAFLGPVAWLSWRSLKLRIRFIRENRVARGVFHAQAILWGGLLGSVLNLYLVALLGRHLWPAVFP